MARGLADALAQANLVHLDSSHKTCSWIRPTLRGSAFLTGVIPHSFSATTAFGLVARTKSLAGASKHREDKLRCRYTSVHGARTVFRLLGAAEQNLRCWDVGKERRKRRPVRLERHIVMELAQLVINAVR